jgi:carbon-monoxide dehydrogenase large subunit
MATETEEVRGIGHSVKRKEDDRFIRGKGNYVDDAELPNMLHMAILRSRWRTRGSVPSTRRGPRSGVVAVVTGELMAQHNLAGCRRCPDTQAARHDSVRFQGQEVAAVRRGLHREDALERSTWTTRCPGVTRAAPT